MSRFNPLLKILYEIEIECADAIEKQRTEETEKNLDNFTKMKRRLAAEMRDLRKVTNPLKFFIRYKLNLSNYSFYST
jgi:hypothetical protein